MALIQYTAPAAISFPTSVTKITGISTAVATDTSAFTYSSGTFTCVRAGRYMIQAQVTLASTAGAASLYLYKNGSAFVERAGFASTAGNNTLNLIETITFSASDTFDLRNIGVPTNAGVSGATTTA